MLYFSFWWEGYWNLFRFYDILNVYVKLYLKLVYGFNDKIRNFVIGELGRDIDI